jgi:hypothetical protein
MLNSTTTFTNTNLINTNREGLATRTITLEDTAEGKILTVTAHYDWPASHNGNCVFQQVINITRDWYDRMRINNFVAKRTEEGEVITTHSIKWINLFCYVYELDTPYAHTEVGSNLTTDQVAQIMIEALEPKAQPHDNMICFDDSDRALSNWAG